ncbi:membrane protein, partial [Thraustotheca clavata]
MSKTQMRQGIRQYLVINLVLPLVIYTICKDHMSQVLALTLSGIPPALHSLREIIQHKTIDVISMLVVFSIVASVVVAVLTDDPKILLMKDSFLTLVTGIAFVTSTCFAKENLICRFHRQFVGPDGQAELNEKYKRPEVQKSTRLMCWVWGCGLIFEACLRVVLIVLIPVDTMVYISPIIMIVCIGTLALWTSYYRKRV